MKDDEIVIAGKRYLSTKKASKLTKYTSDYVGQLARAGKLETTIIGKTRFVEEESLRRYLLDNGKETTALDEKKTEEESTKFYADSRSTFPSVAPKQEQFENEPEEPTPVPSPIDSTEPVSNEPMFGQKLAAGALTLALLLALISTFEGDRVRAEFAQVRDTFTKAAATLSAPKDLIPEPSGLFAQAGLSGQAGILSPFEYSALFIYCTTSGLSVGDGHCLREDTVEIPNESPSLVEARKRLLAENDQEPEEEDKQPVRVVERIVERVSTPELIVSGVSAGELEIRLQELSNEMRSLIAQSSTSTREVIVQQHVQPVERTVALTQIIDQLSDVDITNPTITGGTISDMISIETNKLTVSSLTAGSLTTTGGITSYTSVTAPIFIATSTTATSTFAGGFDISDGGFVYDWQTENVGIGTSSPSATLTVNGTTYLSNATSGLSFRVDDQLGDVTPFVIDGSGNVGIGTTSPVYKLDVWGNFAVGTSSTPALFVDTSTGNVGIGTTSPFTQFSVTGSGSFSENLFVEGDASVDGSIAFGTSTDETATFNARIDSSLIPSADNTYNIGTTSPWLSWRSGFFGTSVSIGGTATTTGTDLTSSGPFTIDTGDTLSINTSNNQDVAFGTGLLSFLRASSTQQSILDTLYVGSTATTTLTSDALAFPGSATIDGSNGTLTVEAGDFDVNASGAVTINGSTITLADPTVLSDTLDVTGLATFVGGFISQASSTIASDFTVTGDTIFGDTTSDTLVVNARVASDLIPDQNATRDLGSTSFYWDDAFVDTLTANSISAASTTISGTQSDTFAINTDNATADDEDATLIFYRGTVVPNALLTWDSTRERFDFNQPLYIQNDSSTTTVPTLGLAGSTGQSADVLHVASSSGADLFSVTSAGTVGVSSSSPAATFSVTGDAWITGQTLLGTDGSNVGIGTTSPFATLSVSGDGYFDGDLTVNSLTSTTSISAPFFTATDASATSTFAGGFNVADGGLVYDFSTNNVGIGTESPSFTLDVAGTISVGNRLNMATSGPLLIGTDHGVSVGDESIAIGKGARTLADTTGTIAGNHPRATVIGFEAGRNSDLFGLTALGYTAARNNTGTRLTALGYAAGESNTSFDVTALGYTAGENNTGSRLTAVGSTAAVNNSGTGVAALGYAAAEDNIGNSVTALGYTAAQDNTGDRLTALGYTAGQRNAGNDVTALGYLAAQDNTGNFVTAVGSDAAENNTGVRLTAVGFGAAQFNSGAAVTAVGDDAAEFNSGGFVTAVGSGAAENNTNDFVTAVGVAAAQDNTGARLSALGHFAGESNTGDEVTALGYTAAQNNTGNSVTALGYAAGESNTGLGLTAQGYLAARNNTGDNVTALGYFAAFNNTGNDVTTLGYQALRYRTATSTVALGSEAGYGADQVQNGFENGVLVGYRTGYNLTTGDNNTLIGYQAGDNLTTGSNNILLGYDIDAQNVGDSNTLNIGNLLFGTDVDGTGTTLSSGNIGIGTSSPFAKLSVAGDGYFDGDLTVNSLTSTTSISAPFFIATDASATSTFAGGFNVADGGLVYDWQTGNTTVGNLLSVGGTGTSTIEDNLEVLGALQVGNSSLYLDTDSIENLSGDLALQPTGGSVGIGTTSPSDLLSIEGDVSFSEGGNYRSFYWNAGSGRLGLGERAVNAGTTLHVFEQNAVGDLVTFEQDSSAGVQTWLDLKERTGSSGSGIAVDFTQAGTLASRIHSLRNGTTQGYNLIFSTTPDGGSLAERVRIDEDGQVGVGTDSPQNRLDVSGASVIGANYAGVETAPTNGLLVEGSTGIGTTSPSTDFSVSGNGYFTGGLGVGVATTTPGVLQTSGDVSVGGELTVAGTGVSIFTEGRLHITGTPDGTNINEGSVYINPPSAGVNNVLAGFAVGGTEKVRIDAEGDVQITGLFNSSNAAGTNEFAGSFSVGEDTTLGDGTDDTVVFNARIDSALVPATDDSYDLGSETFRWSNIYASTTTIDNLVAGGTASSTFIINEGNTTADTENATLAFERGSISPNATLTWNATDDRFEFNDFEVQLANVLTVAGSASSSFAGPLWLTGSPEGTGLADATLYINPPGAAADESLLSIGVAGTKRFAVDAEGDTTIQASLGIENQLYDITQDVLTINDSVKIVGEEIVDSTDTTRIEIGSTNTITGNTAVTGTLDVSSSAQFGSANIDLIDSVGKIAGLSTTYFNTDTSANLAGIITDETGTGALVFADAPSLTDLTVTSGGIDVTGNSTITGTLSSLTGLSSSGTITFSGISDGVVQAIGGTLSATSSISGAFIEDVFLRNDGDDTTTGQLTAANFVASDAGATSTFAGGVNVENGGLVYDFSTNRVGIGTESPSSPLDISGGSLTLDNNTFVRWRDSGGTARTILSFDSNDDLLIGRSSATDVLRLYAGGTTERMTILENGNVGIGTTSPSEKLHVETTGGGSNVMAAFSNLDTGTTAVGQIQVQGNADQFNIQQFGSNNTATLDGVAMAGYSRLQADSDGLALQTKTGAPIDFFTNDSHRVTIDGSGNVGIGTDSPDSELSVAGTSDFGITLQTDTGSAKNWINFQEGGVDAMGIEYDGGNDDLTIWDRTGGGSERVTIQRSGRVGIGTTSPMSKLSLDGTAGGASGIAIGTFDNDSVNYAFQVFDENSKERNFWIRSPGGAVETLDMYVSGSVGIGTTSPAATLSVAGDIYADGNLTVSGLTATSSLTVDTLTLASGSITDTTGTIDFDNEDLTGSGDWITTGSVQVGSFGSGIAASGSTALFFTNSGENLAEVRRVGTGAGTIRVDQHSTGGTADNTPGYSFLDDTDTGVLLYGADKLGFATGGDTKMVVDSSGNVGVGTDNPSDDLHIYRVDGSEASFLVEGDGPGATANLTIDSHTDAKLRLTYRSDTQGSYVDFRNNKTDNFRIVTGNSDGGSTEATLLQHNYGTDEVFFPSGNVGIGTTSPFAKLSVGGDIYADGDLTVNSLTSTTSISAPFFVATDASATSTFAGGLNVESGGLVYDFSTNNVGIGTESPNGELHVSGSSNTSIDIESTGSNIPHLELISGSNKWQVEAGRDGDNFTIRDTAGGGERFRIDTDGNVGIGTTSPAYKLAVNGDVLFSDNSPIFRLRDADSTGDSVLNYIQWEDSSGSQIGLIGFDTSSDDDFVIRNVNNANIEFQTNGSSADVTIDNSGNVGIGTTNPNQNLHINDSGSSSYLQITNSATGDTGSDGLFIGMSNEQAIIHQRETSSLTFKINTNDVGNFTTSGDFHLDNRLGIGDTTPEGLLEVSASGGGTDLFMLSSDDGQDGDRFIVKNSGFVGIGTTSPSKNLHVHSESGNSSIEISTNAADGDAFIDFTDNGSRTWVVGNNAGQADDFIIDRTTINGDDFVIDGGTGNVGIGTTSPGARLELDGGDLIIGKQDGLQFRDSTENAREVLNYDSNLVTLQNPLNASIAFNTNGNERVRIANSGNVGIGTTSPSKKLHIQSSTFNDLLRLQRDAGETYDLAIGSAGQLELVANDGSINFLVEQGGGVGIGTTNPGTYGSGVSGARDLHIASSNGNAQLTLESGATNDSPSIRMHNAGGTADQRTALFQVLDSDILKLKSVQDNNTTQTENIFVAELDTGDVGIGTDDPDAVLDLTRTSGGHNYLHLEGQLGSTDRRFIEIRSNEDGLSNRYFNRFYSDYDNNGEGQTLRYSMATDGTAYFNGNVGIGTSTPDFKLSVSGDIAGHDTIRFQRDVTSEIYSGESNSNAGQFSFKMPTGETILDVTRRGATYAKLGKALDSDGVEFFIKSEGTTGDAAGFRALGQNGNVDTPAYLQLQRSGTDNGDSVVGTGHTLGEISFEGYDTSNYVTGTQIKSVPTQTWSGSARGSYLSFLTTADDSTTLSERLRITDTGNVGIGTTSPFAKLSVAGDIYADGDLTVNSLTSTTSISAPFFVATDASATSTFAGGFNVESGGLVYDFSTNRVGIGTESPSYPLDVSGPIRSTSQIHAETNNSVSGEFDSIAYRFSEARGWGYNSADDAVFYNAANGRIPFIVENAETGTLFVGSNGRVGIGTDNPSAKLDVDGQIFLSALSDTAITNGVAFRRDTGSAGIIDAAGHVIANIDVNNNNTDRYFAVRTNDTNELFRVQENGNVGIGTESPASTLDVVGDLILRGSGGSAHPRLFRDSSTGGLHIGRFNDGDSSTDTRVTIQGTGNVGIGTSTPDSKFHLYTGELAADVDAFTIDSDADVNNDAFVVRTQGVPGTFTDAHARFVITGLGDVGIGTTSPSTELEITDGSTPFLRVTDSTSDIGTILGSDNSRGFAGTITNNDFSLRTNNTNRLTIDTDGNVGIGTESPDELLEVSGGNILITQANTVGALFTERTGDVTQKWRTGGISASGSFSIKDETNNTFPFQIADGAPTGSFLIQSDGDGIFDAGNVGIGTDSPTTNLNVEGSAVNIALFENTGADAGQIQVRNSEDIAYFGTDDTKAYFGLTSTLSSNNLNIDTDGNVGIGTTSPTNLLDVEGNVAIGASFSGDQNAPANGLIVEGSVGIGTASPGSFTSDGLVVSGAGTREIYLESNNNANISIDRGNTAKRGEVRFKTAGTDKWFVGSADSDDAGDGSEFFIGESIGGANAAFWIESGGNVGIGTSSPLAELDVSANRPSIRLSSEDTNISDNVTFGEIEFVSADNSSSGDIVGSIAVKTPVGDFGSHSVLAFSTYDSGTLSEALRIDEGGNVGIGETDPDQALEISCSGATCLHIDSTSGANIDIDRAAQSNQYRLKFQTAGTDEWAIGNFSGNNGDLHFSEDGTATTRLVLQEGGNIGIGTTSPITRLHVDNGTGALPNTGAADAIIQDNNSASDNAGLMIVGGASGTSDLFFGDANKGDIGKIRYDHSADAMIFDTDDTEKVRIDSSGQVGIGTNGPDVPLHIEGGSGISSLNQGLGSFQIGSYSNTHLAIDSNEIQVSSNGSAANLFLQANGGNVGIGTNSPGERLEVNGNIEISSNSNYYMINGQRVLQYDGSNQLILGASQAADEVLIKAGGDEKVRIDSSGNVGIGTDSPVTPLHVASDGSANSIMSSQIVRITPADLGNGINIGSDGTDAMIGVTNNDTDLHLLSRTGGVYSKALTLAGTSGNVGIGTTSPYARLSVVGEAVFEKFHATSTSATSTVSGNLHVKKNLQVGDSSTHIFGNATSTFGGGVNLTGGGCVSVNGTCTGINNSGTANQLAYYASSGSTLSGTSNFTYEETTTGSPWDVENAEFTHSTTTGPVFNGDAFAPADIHFKSDGTRALYLATTTGTGVNVSELRVQTLSTPWDISTANNVASTTEKLDVSGQETTPTGIFFGDSGSKVYVTGTAGGGDIHQYALSTAWDLNSGSFTQSQSVSGTDSLPRDVFWRSDGEKMFFLGRGSNTVYSYDVFTPWDVTDIFADDSFSVNSQETNPHALFFKPDGTEMYIIGGTNDIHVYTLSSAWDLGTASFDSQFSPSNNDPYNGLYLKSDGTQMYTTDYTGVFGDQNRVEEYDIDSTETNPFVGIGGSPTQMLTVGSTNGGSLCVDDGSSCSGAGTTDGDIYYNAAHAGYSDVAEKYPSVEEDFKPGTIVSIDHDAIAEAQKDGTTDDYPNPYVKTARSGDRAIVGAISTNPGLILGSDYDRNEADHSVGLSGRIPVRVNLDGGAIAPGDRITISSTTPGVGTKATSPNQPTIGYALSGYAGSGNDLKFEGEGKVMVFIDLSAGRISEYIEGETIELDGEGESAYWQMDPSGKIVYLAPVDLNGFPIRNVEAITSASGKWTIDKNGILAVQEVQTEKLCVGDTCVDEEGLKQLLQQANVASAGAPSDLVDPVNDTEDTSDSTEDTSTTTDTSTTEEATDESTTETEDTSTTTDDTTTASTTEETTTSDTTTEEDTTTAEDDSTTDTSTTTTDTTSDEETTTDTSTTEDTTTEESTTEEEPTTTEETTDTSTDDTSSTEETTTSDSTTEESTTTEETTTEETTDTSTDDSGTTEEDTTTETTDTETTEGSTE